MLSLGLALGSRVAGAGGTPVQRPPTPPASNAPPSPPQLITIDLDETPPPCQPLARQALAPNAALALPARISLASCLADAALAPLALLDCEASKLEVEDATARSFELLADVIEHATDDTTKVIAEHTRAELYTTMTRRMVATVPPPDGSDASTSLHDIRQQLLESLLASWRDKASEAHAHVLAIVKRDPRLAKNPVVAAAARAARDDLQRAAAAPSQHDGDEP